MKKETRLKLEVDRNNAAITLDSAKSCLCTRININKEISKLSTYWLHPKEELDTLLSLALDNVEFFETELYALNKKLKRDIFDESFYRVY